VSYIPTRKLPALRLVCKDWDAAIVPYLRSQYFPVKFHGHSSYTAELIEMNYFNETFGPVPQHVMFSNFTIALDRPLEHETVATFFTIAGPYMRKLALLEYSTVAANGIHFPLLCSKFAPDLESFVINKGCFFEAFNAECYQYENYQQVCRRERWTWNSKMSENEPWPVCPNLKHLEIDEIEMVSKEGNFAKYLQYKKLFLTNFLISAPGLNSLKTDELQVLGNARLENIKKFDTALRGAKNLKYLLELCEKGFKLTHLSMEYEDSEKSVGDIKNGIDKHSSLKLLKAFLSTQKDTLVKCELLYKMAIDPIEEISDENYDPVKELKNFIFVFPEMKSLKFLNPSDVAHFWSHFKFGPTVFSFATHFPNLQTLCLCNNTVRYWEYFSDRTNIPPCLTVSTLRILGNKKPICANEIKFLAGVFPLVRNLQVIDILPEALRTLWQYFTTVQWLTLYLSYTNDQASYDTYFCGCPYNDCVALSKVLTGERVFDVFEWEGLFTDMFVFPSIRDLNGKRWNILRFLHLCNAMHNVLGYNRYN